MHSDNILNAMPRLSHWNYLRDLWEKQIPLEEMSVLLERYIARIYREEGDRSKFLIAPLRWLALICHMQGDYEKEIRVLSRTVSLMQFYLGKNHHQTVHALIKLLSTSSDTEQHLILVRHFLQQRQDQLLEMDWNLLQAFVMALYVPLAGKTDGNRQALQLLNQYVMHHLRFGSLPLSPLSQAVELLWYITDEFGGHTELVPIVRLLANKLSNVVVADDVEQKQIERLHRFVAEVVGVLTVAQQRKIRPQLSVV